MTSEEQNRMAKLISVFYDCSREESDKPRSAYWYALSSLVGRTDIEAVKMANKYADKNGLERITVKEFRKWLPMALSQAFAIYTLDLRQRWG